MKLAKEPSIETSLYLTPGSSKRGNNVATKSGTVVSALVLYYNDLISKPPDVKFMSNMFQKKGYKIKRWPEFDDILKVWEISCGGAR